MGLAKVSSARLQAKMDDIAGTYSMTGVTPAIAAGVEKSMWPLVELVDRTTK